MIYLNNATTSYPKPERVISQVNRYMQLVPSDVHRKAYDGGEADIKTACRQKLALLFNIENINDIVFTSGATHSINMVIQGLEELNNGHVITTVLEHSAVLRALKLKERRGEIEVTILDCDKTGQIKISSFAEAIKHNTKAVIVNHVSNVTGSILNLELLSELAHEEQLLLIVDASQSGGCLPIDVKKLDIDVLIFTGHKSLYGIGGIGGFYVKENLNLKPLIVGGTGIKSDSLYQSEERPSCYESGTQNIIGIAALEAGVSFILEEGLTAIHHRKEALYEMAVIELEKIPEIIFYGERRYTTPIICFNIKNENPKNIGYLLGNEYGIIVRTGLLCAPLIHEKIGSGPLGAVRVSLSYFTTEKEIEALIMAVKGIVELSKKKTIVIEEAEGVSCY